MFPITLILLTFALFFTLLIASKLLCVVGGDLECEPITAFEVVGCILFWGILLYSHFTPLIAP